VEDKEITGKDEKETGGPDQEQGGKQYMGGAEAPEQQPDQPFMGQPYMGQPYMMPPMGQPYMVPPMGYNPYMMPPMPYPVMPGYMPYPPQQGYMPEPPSQEPQHQCGHHQEADPFGGLMGMFGEMIGNNPQLNAVGKMVESTGSDFMKGLVVGAGVAMLLSSETVRTAITDILGKSVSMFTDEQEESI